jgi:hypothetical protein
MKYPLITATSLFLAFFILACSPEQEEEFHFYTFSIETERVLKQLCVSQEENEFTETLCELGERLELYALSSASFPIESDSILRSHLTKLMLNVHSLKKNQLDSTINQLILIIDPSLENFQLFNTYKQMYAIEKELNLICQTNEAYVKKKFLTEEVFLEFMFCEFKDSLITSKHAVNYQNDEACAFHFIRFRKTLEEGSYSLEEKRTELLSSFQSIFEIIKME